MAIEQFQPCLNSQRGAALLILLLLAIVAVTTFYLSSLNTQRLRNDKVYSTQEALFEAKTALIGHALTSQQGSPGRYGLLPCPDKGVSVAEGAEQGDCGNNNGSQLGRFPWRSLETPALRDGEGECLWYVVSNDYKKSNESAMLNGDTPGSIQLLGNDGITVLQGATLAEQPIAAIIAPGKAIATQDRENDNSSPGVRECGGNYDPTNYLEDVEDIEDVDNAADETPPGSPHKLALGKYGSATLNDIILPLFRHEIFGMIVESQAFRNDVRLLIEGLGECLIEYSENNGGPLPNAAPVELGNYGNESDYQMQADTYFGRFPYFDELDTCLDSPAREMRNNWKDHIFYVTEKEAITNPSSLVCGGSQCFSVNGGARDYAAIVFFAGEPLAELDPPQQRVTTGDEAKADLYNYLEGSNFSNYEDGDYTDTDFVLQSPSTDPFNDELLCLRFDAGALPGPLQVDNDCDGT